MRLIVACFVLCLGLVGCSSGWDEASIGRTKGTCIKLTAPMHGDSLAEKLCSCYLEHMIAKFPNNDQNPEEIQPILNKCSEQYLKEGTN